MSLDLKMRRVHASIFQDTEGQLTVVCHMVTQSYGENEEVEEV